MTERRFNEDEVAAIFKWASEAQHTSQPQLPAGQGMTLAQLQEIGRDVGISAEHLAAASRVVNLSWKPTARHFLGLPVGVGLSVDLPRKVTDEEWERLVVDLRETFDARGKLISEGSLRQWSNGNLQAMLEPTPSGQRIRFRTVKGDAQSMMIGGLAMFGFAAVTALLAIARGGTGDLGFFMAIGTLATMGAAMFGFGGLRLPGWARLRSKQMQEIAARVAASTSTAPEHGRLAD